MRSLHIIAVLFLVTVTPRLVLADVADDLREGDRYYDDGNLKKAAAAYDGAIRKVLSMLGDVPEGHVAVYACGQDVAAHLGELSVTSLKARGVAGCVLDGGCRDVRFILEEGFPVFCRFVTPEDSTWRPSGSGTRCSTEAMRSSARPSHTESPCSGG